jgi:hypothetical protein
MAGAAGIPPSLSTARCCTGVTMLQRCAVVFGGFGFHRDLRVEFARDDEIRSGGSSLTATPASVLLTLRSASRAGFERSVEVHAHENARFTHAPDAVSNVRTSWSS